MFEDLDEIDRQREAVLAAAQSRAHELDAAAAEERRRLLVQAHADAERIAAQLLDDRRIATERRARAMLIDAEREAERILARGQARLPAFVPEVITAVMESRP